MEATELEGVSPGETTVRLAWMRPILSRTFIVP